MRWTTPTPEQEAGYADWVETLPEPSRSLAKRFDPWTLYRLTPTGSRVTIESFRDDGTVRVFVSADYNLVIFGRSVFGVAPDDLVECDLPGPDEQVGTFPAVEI